MTSVSHRFWDLGGSMDDPAVYARTVFLTVIGLLFFVGWVQCQRHGARTGDNSVTARVFRAGFGLGGLAAGAGGVASLLHHHWGVFTTSPPYRLETAAGPPSDPLIYAATVAGSLVGLVLFVAGWKTVNRHPSDDGDTALHRIVMGLIGLAGLVVCVTGVVVIGTHHLGR